MERFKPSNNNCYNTKASSLLLVRTVFAKRDDGQKKKNIKEY